jgi:hypothetical protein
MEKLYKNYRYGVWYMGQLSQSDRDSMNSLKKYPFLDPDLYKILNFEGKDKDLDMGKFIDFTQRLFGNLKFSVHENLMLNMNVIVDKLVELRPASILTNAFLEVLYPKFIILTDNPTQIIELPTQTKGLKPQLGVWTNIKNKWNEYLKPLIEKAKTPTNQSNQPEKQPPVVKDEEKEKEEALLKSIEEARETEKKQLEEKPADTNFFKITGVPEYALPNKLTWKEAWEKGDAVDHLKEIVGKDWGNVIDSSVTQLKKESRSWIGSVVFDVSVGQV